MGSKEKSLPGFCKNNRGVKWKYRRRDSLSHHTSPDDIENMTNAARCVLNAIKTGEKIYVFGDYDADGVCSMAILFLLLSHLKNEIGSKSEITIRAPRRLSEGYGISQKAVDEVEEGLLLLITESRPCRKLLRLKRRVLQ